MPQRERDTHIFTQEGLGKHAHVLSDPSLPGFWVSNRIGKSFLLALPPAPVIWGRRLAVARADRSKMALS